MHFQGQKFSFSLKKLKEGAKYIMKTTVFKAINIKPQSTLMPKRHKTNVVRVNVAPVCNSQSVVREGATQAEPCWFWNRGMELTVQWDQGAGKLQEIPQRRELHTYANPDIFRVPFEDLAQHWSLIMWRDCLKWGVAWEGIPARIRGHSFWHSHRTGE